MRRVDFGNLGAEELGSVYESLLELIPHYDFDQRSYTLTVLPGNERKESGLRSTPLRPWSSASSTPPWTPCWTTQPLAALLKRKVACAPRTHRLRPCLRLGPLPSRRRETDSQTHRRGRDRRVRASRARVSIRNFRGVRSGRVLLDSHSLLVGGNAVGKSTVCEALDLVWGLERLYRLACDRRVRLLREEVPRRGRRAGERPAGPGGRLRRPHDTPANRQDAGMLGCGIPAAVASPRGAKGPERGGRNPCAGPFAGEKLRTCETRRKSVSRVSTGPSDADATPATRKITRM